MVAEQLSHSELARLTGVDPDLMPDIRSFLPPHPLAELVAGLEFEEAEQCCAGEGLFFGMDVEGPRRACLRCHKVLKIGWLAGWFDSQGEPQENTDIHGADLLCLQCEAEWWTSEGYTRAGELTIYGIPTAIWVKHPSDVVYQTLDATRR
jgi:hypothetical protein